MDYNDSIKVLAIDHDSINSFVVNRSNDSLPTSAAKILEKKQTVIVSSLGNFGGYLRNLLYKYYPQKTIKSAYSINDCLEWQNRNNYSLENICHIKFDDSILDSAELNSLNSVEIAPDTLIAGNSINGIGWIVIDGHLNYDSENPLLSFWEYSLDGSDSSRQRFYVKDIIKFSTDGFGLIITGFPEINRAADKWLILKSLSANGIGAIITLSDSLSKNQYNEFLLSFFDKIKSQSPAEGFNTSYKLTGLNNFKSEKACFYGNNGWNSKDKQTIKALWYKQAIARADSAAALKDWNKAARLYDSGLAQWQGSGISVSDKYSVMDRAVGVYLRAGNSRKALSSQKEMINGLFWPLNTQAKMWQDYARIARNAKLYDDEYLALNKSIDIGIKSGDSSIVVRGYLDFARYYSDLKKPDDMKKYAILAVNLAEGANDDTLKAASYFTLGQSFYMENNYAEAGANYSKSLQPYLDNNDYRNAYRVSSAISKIYNALYYYGRENTILQDAYKYSQTSGDSFSVFRSRLLLSHSYLLNSNPRKALTQLEGLPDSKYYGIQGSLERSEIYQWFDKTDSAWFYAQKALATATGDSRPTYHSIYEQIGDILRQKNDYKSALEQYRLALEYIKSDSLAEKDYILEFKQAATRASLGEKADSLFQSISDSTSDEFMRSLCQYQLALLNEKRGDQNKANELFLAAAEHNNPAVTRFLKWRAYYHMGKSLKGPQLEKYLASADSIVRIIPTESGYFRNKYFLDGNIAQFYDDYAAYKIEIRDLSSSLAYFEVGFVRELAEENILIGRYDSVDESILDKSIKLFENDSSGNYSNYLTKSGGENNSRIALWAGYGGSLSDLQTKLNGNNAVIRLYQTPTELELFYIDEDTLIHSSVSKDTASINRDIGSFSEVMKYQSRADSALEYWYNVLILPFEKQLEQKTDLIICPDFEWMAFPFEALKRPGAAYLADMYSITRAIGLPGKTVTRKSLKTMPCFIDTSASSDNATLAIMGIAEAVGKCNEHYGKIIISGRSYLNIAGENINRSNSIISEIPRDSMTKSKEIALEIMLAGRDGFDSYLKPLWSIPEQSLSYYFWKLLTDLRDGIELTKAVGEANSYNYGIYNGLPYYWAFSAIYKIY